MRIMIHGIATAKDDALLKVYDYGYSSSHDTALGAFDNSGKHYFEATQETGVIYIKVGLAVIGNTSLVNYWYIDDARGGCYANPGGTVSTPGYSSDPGTRRMVAYDMDAGKVWFGVNGTWMNSGNPVTGANPIYSNLSGYLVSPYTELSKDAAVRFYVKPADWLYAPTGFLPPTENHPVAKVHAFHEIDRGGALGIGGKVTEFSQPGAYKVRLYDQERGTLLATTTSAENGDYAFDGLNEKPKFVIAFDHTEPVQNAAIKDNVVPS